MDKLTERINFLYKKSKTSQLTEDEKEEQRRLREKYINNIKKNLRAQLGAIQPKSNEDELN
ncbi:MULTISPECIES: DUF896 domain-containing protein [Clostridium]|uniref:UPF0291 protein CLJU_c21920 n=2 Tax=Clostridium TaxID=1485 RepID=D8GKB2_CLOLD|nr:MULTISPECIES: DUF896 domain-containing protein [Clostridium]ADK15252.1 hypothetical protein CLJU_c21920 [Clostridium ljungdahlii DSM 13528]OAA88732.1 hypothetical protein WX45_02667 [Clostridium ljungdahlii DSM 13528]OAA94913.1 hypothetical protein WX73_01321 [Clostridium coskatii]OBR91653.1 hypothetical protein CLCOS_32930 [Clostridium coskatii]